MAAARAMEMSAWETCPAFACRRIAVPKLIGDRPNYPRVILQGCPVSQPRRPTGWGGVFAMAWSLDIATVNCVPFPKVLSPLRVLGPDGVGRPSRACSRPPKVRRVNASRALAPFRARREILRRGVLKTGGRPSRV